MGLGLSILAAFPAAAKDRVVAFVHTSFGTDLEEGSVVRVRWSLLDERSGEAFSACSVFVRLIGDDQQQSEAFSECGADAGSGNYEAIATVPRGGVRLIQIGVAGTASDGSGGSVRSDWLIALTNDPIGK